MVLGRAIGNLVWSIESRGSGIYIAGGIVPRCLKEVLKSSFRHIMQEISRIKKVCITDSDLC